MLTRTGVGKIAIAPCDVAISQDITGVYVDREQVDVRYLFYLMIRGTEELKKLNQGTSINGIIRRDLERYPVFAPTNVAEQRCIVEILGAVSRAIENTESLITKYQKIKTGLMHDLFTRGVDENGRLRPTREERPEIYKESPVGWIPRSWSSDLLESLLANVPNPMRSGPFGSALLKSELVEDGIPLLGIDNVFNERFEPTFRRFVPSSKFAELSRYAVRPRDVVITIMGTVGRCCVLPSDIGQALSSKHLWTMTFDRQRVLPELICWQLNSAPWAVQWFAKPAQGGIMEAIQSSTLKSLRVPVPPPSEQEQILHKYVGIQERLLQEEEQAAKLHLMKKGLMNDLLTRGRPIQTESLVTESAHV